MRRDPALPGISGDEWAFRQDQFTADKIERLLRERGTWGHPDWTVGKLRRKFRWANDRTLRLAIRRMSEEP